MDKAKFDGLARKLSTEQNRRSALRIAGAGLVAGLVSGLLLAGESDATGLSSEACSPTGTRCGRRRKGKGPKAKRRQQPACTKCCSKHTIRQRNGQRRCSCVPDLRECRRDDQCCSGLCLKVEDFCGCDSEEVPEEFPVGRKVCIPGWLDPGLFNI
jgi:hypothetical protein